MQIEIKLDASCKETKVIIFTDKMTDEVNELLRRLSDEKPETIIGFKENCLEILQPLEIIRIYSENQRIYAQTEKSTYTLRMRLYELEERLDGKTFVRISNSEIIKYQVLFCIKIYSDRNYKGGILIFIQGI